MLENWQTIEQAAVILGLSVRTVNRHITNGKLASRLLEGRREVLIPSDMLNGRGGVATSSATTPTGSATTANGKLSEYTADSAASSSHTAGASGPTAYPTDAAVSAEVPPEKPMDMQAMLSLADSIDDKASLAVTAYQTLARSAELQAQSLRRVAFGAWAAVGVLAVGVVVATGWGVRTVTSAETNADYLSRSLAEQRENNKQEIARREAELRRISSERDLTRQELTELRSQSDVLRGRVEVLTEQQRHAQAQAEMAAFVLRQHSSTQPSTQPATQPTAGGTATSIDAAALASATLSTDTPGKPSPSATQPAGDRAAGDTAITRPSTNPSSKPFAHPPRATYTNEPDLLDPR